MTTIAPSFKRMFPDYAAQFEELCVSVYRPKRRAIVDGVPTFFAGNTYQLSGYKTKGDDEPFTRADAEANIERILNHIRAGRAEIAGWSLRERYEHQRAQLLDMCANFNEYGEFFQTYRHASGDGACIFWRYLSPDMANVRFWDRGEIARTDFDREPGSRRDREPDWGLLDAAFEKWLAEVDA